MAIPLPRPNADTKPYWDAAARGQLLYQRCRACNHVQFYPRGTCVACHADKIEWRESAKQGTIVTFTEVFRAPTPAFKEMAPYIIALVDLDEGFRMMVNIVDRASSVIAIGGRVRIVFQEASGVILPQGQLQ